jgi:hypothetical protein
VKLDEKVMKFADVFAESDYIPEPKETKSNLMAVKVTLDDGSYYVTDVNADGGLESAEKYFLGKNLNFGIEDDDIKKCVKVELA